MQIQKNYTYIDQKLYTNMLNSLLFIGCLYSDLQKKEFERCCKIGYQYAAQTFQESLLDGFINNGVNVSVLTIPSLGTFPLSYRRAVVGNCDFVYKGDVLGKSAGFINLPFFNRPSFSYIYDYLENWYDNTQDEIKNVLVYGLHISLMKAAVFLKNRHDDVKLCVVIPDLPEYMACNKYYRLLGLKDKDNKEINNLINYFDTHVLLSKYMREKLNLGGKPYTVVEGIFSSELSNEDSKRNKNTILYSGALSVRYGLIDLVKAFSLIPDKDYKLWLCGAGDAVKEIEELAALDKRISYLGRKKHEEVLRLQKQASLLVNPRHSNEIFTRYSFPSKTMEYLSSGTPVVMCPLQCIPDDYKDHLFFFENESIEGFRNKIMEICGMDSEELIERGRKARDFILSEKNATKQVKRIIDLILNENSNS